MSWHDGSASKAWTHSPYCARYPAHLKNDGSLYGNEYGHNIASTRNLSRRLKGITESFSETFPFIQDQPFGEPVLNATKTLTIDKTSFSMSDFDTAVSNVTTLPLVDNFPRFCANPFQSRSTAFCNMYDGAADIGGSVSLSFDSMVTKNIYNADVITAFNAMEVSLVGFREPFYLTPAACYSVKNGIVGAYDSDIHSALYGSELGSYQSFDTGSVAFPEILYEPVSGGITYFVMRMNGTYQVSYTYDTNLKPKVKYLTRGEFLALQSLSDADLCTLDIADTTPPTSDDLGAETEAIYGMIAMRGPHLQSIKAEISYDIDFGNYYYWFNVYGAYEYRRNVGNSASIYYPSITDTGYTYTIKEVDRHDFVTSPADYQADYNVLIS